MTTIIFDKTGTLTHGKPTVTDEIMVADPTALKRLNMGDLSGNTSHHEITLEVIYIDLILSYVQKKILKVIY